MINPFPACLKMPGNVSLLESGPNMGFHCAMAVEKEEF